MLIAMKPADLPFAVVSLDEGAQTPQGEVNAGDQIADRLVTAAQEAEDSPERVGAVRLRVAGRGGIGR